MMNDAQPSPPPHGPPIRQAPSRPLSATVGIGCFLTALGALLLVGAIVLVGVIGALSSTDAPLLARKPGVAVLDIRDEMVDERAILSDLERLTSNPNTRALVLRVNSPGGVITVVEEIYEALKRVRDEDELPLVASMGSVAASGGYFVCLPAQRIYANNSSLTGSVGVLIENTTAAGLLERIGVDFTQIRSGEHKGAGSFMERLTEPQQAHLQALVDNFHAFFMEVVAEERGLPAETLEIIADGRVFMGRDALELGLVDEVGDLHAAIEHAAELAGLPKDPRIIRIHRQQPFLPRLLHHIESATTGGGRAGLLPKYLAR